MTQSPCLPELPKPAAKILAGDGWQAFFDTDQMNAHGLACYEAGSAAAAQAVPGWISVEDRLPDERASAYLVAVIAKKTYSEGSNYPGMGIRSVVQDWVVRNYASSYTHWMALPEITPAAPTQGAEGAAPQAVDDLVHRIAREHRLYGRMLTSIDLCKFAHALFAAAPREADALREALKACLDSLEYIDRAHPEVSGGMTRFKSIKAARAALAQHQPQQGEQL